MNTRGLSLRARLALTLVAPLLVLGTWFLAQAYETARTTSNNVYDRVLFGSALAISERIVVGRGNTLEVDLPYVALEMLTSVAQDRVYYRIDAAGKPITGYGDLPTPPLPGDPQPGSRRFYDATFRGAPVRVVQLSGTASNLRTSIPFTVYVAETTQARQLLIRETVTASALRISITILAALALVWFGISWGLRPLRRLQSAFSRRSPEDLRPVEHTAPAEVAPLIVEMNALMARLDSTLTATRTFTGNASHQLRTPLAIARANLELAATRTDEREWQTAVAAAYEATKQCQNLVESLLLLAQIDGRKVDPRTAPPVDLTDLARSVTRDLAPAAVEKDHDLSFVSSCQQCVIKADQMLLAEAIKNLVNNAITHSPAQSQIHVSVEMGHDGRPSVVVEDDGPGISQHLREKATERLVRFADNTTGSGLGLAVTAEVVRQHHGALSLAKSDLGGLKATIVFEKSRET
ncbi:MAG: sensor histidine kinase [Pseudomonadota bacterium]